MAKVEGSNPFIRLRQNPRISGGFVVEVVRRWGISSRGYHPWVQNVAQNTGRRASRLHWGRWFEQLVGGGIVVREMDHIVLGPGMREPRAHRVDDEQGRAGTQAMAAGFAARALAVAGEAEST